MAQVYISVLQSEAAAGAHIIGDELTITVYGGVSAAADPRRFQGAAPREGDISRTLHGQRAIAVHGIFAVKHHIAGRAGEKAAADIAVLIIDFAGTVDHGIIQRYRIGSAAAGQRGRAVSAGDPRNAVAVGKLNAIDPHGVALGGETDGETSHQNEGKTKRDENA